MVYDVYKIVRVVKEEDKDIYKSFMLKSLPLTYKLDETTVSYVNAPMFVFLSQQEAQEYIDTCPPHAYDFDIGILKGTTTERPYPIQTKVYSLLWPSDIESIDDILAFWTGQLTPFFGPDVKDTWYGCSNFTPTKVVTFIPAVNNF